MNDNPSANDDASVRVRFAPSPTGSLHVGGARTALFNWLWARHEGGTLVLRIEDTDVDRSTEEMIDDILDGLEWLGIEWDEGPHFQSERAGRHREAVDELLESGHAYPCFCTMEELEAERQAAIERKQSYVYSGRCRDLDSDEAARRREDGEPHTIRFAVPRGTTAWHDVVHHRTEFDNDTIGDFIVLRTDGAPVYNLAVTVDDLDMGITHVIRGDDHVSNTPRQILLYEALGAPVPAFAHVPLILGEDKRKLSKRHGAVSVTAYREEGYLPEAFVNFLALLGWSPGDDREVMSVDEIVDAFTLDRITGKSAIFDTRKLEWLNGQHLSNADGETIARAVKPRFVDAGVAPEEELEDEWDRFVEIVSLVKTRSRTLREVVDQGRPFYPGEIDYDDEAVETFWKDRSAALEALAVAADFVAAEPDFDDLDRMEANLRARAGERGVKAGKVMQSIRVAITGQRVSPGIFETMAAMGRELVAERIDRARGWLEASG